MDFHESDPLAHLQTAYARLGLDSYATGIEKLSVWNEWSAHAARRHLLTESERLALDAIRAAWRKLKGDCGNCMMHVPLSPALQISLLREWYDQIHARMKLPFSQQRSSSLVELNKKIVNACCTGRARDAWKHTCAEYAKAFADCVYFTRQHMREIWKGDLAHHVVCQLVLSAPGELAVLLATCLPRAEAVAAAHRYTYERAVVCILRSHCTEAIELLKLRALPVCRLPKSRWHLRVAGHFVTHGWAAGARVLRMLLELSDEDGRELVHTRPGRLLLQRCLRPRGGPLLQTAQATLVCYTEKWGRPGFAHESTFPSWLRKLQLEEGRRTRAPEFPRSWASEAVPEHETHCGGSSDVTAKEQENAAGSLGTSCRKLTREESGPPTTILLSEKIQKADIVTSWAPTAYWSIVADDCHGGLLLSLHLPRSFLLSS